MKTIDYYNLHAAEFIGSTLHVDMESLYQPFLKLLPQSARILDIGCGSGRDSLAFKNEGYHVDAMDYSAELVKKATELTGIQVKFQSFYDLNEVAVYDGIWACASLLHCERCRLAEVLQKMLCALKPNGVIYMSFKYGDSDREKDGREFTDLNERQAEELLAQFDNVSLIQQWITIDKRPDRTEQWLNILWKKSEFSYYPDKLIQRHEVKEKLQSIPVEPGIYFWWIKNLPSNVPLSSCIRYGNYYLVYAGISPDKKGKPNSKATLKIRIRTHYFGNAEGSTLRRTLGILLADQSGFPLRRVGSGKRMTFTHMGEQWLDQWMEENARISYVVTSEPWILEERIFKQISLPLNLKGNEHNFKSTLSHLRKMAIEQARTLDIADESKSKRTGELE